MITIKLPYNIDSVSDLNIIKDIARAQTVVKKWAYNRFLDGLNEKSIRDLISTLINIDCLDSWFIQSSIYDSKAIYLSGHDKKTHENKKVIFNKHNYIRRLKGLITKEEYKELTNNSNYIYSVGEAPQKGNRKFELDIKNNKILFKPKLGIKIWLNLPNLRKNIKTQLVRLDELSKLNNLPITFKLDLNYIYISFEESKLYERKIDINLNENKILGIDLNPNHIGLSVLLYNKNNKFKIIKTLSYDLSKLTNKKDNHNKLKHEVIEISKRIINFCLHNQIKYIGLEQLKINSKDNQKGKNYNSLVNNKWLRTLLTEQIEKRAKLYNLIILKVLPYYSSYIGNLQHEYVDEVNASIEVARRCYEMFILKFKDRFYPEFSIKERLIRQWKDCIDFDIVKEWKELFRLIKNLELRYRVSLKECKYSYKVLRNSSDKSSTKLYIFV